MREMGGLVALNNGGTPQFGLKGDGLHYPKKNLLFMVLALIVFWRFPLGKSLLLSLLFVLGK